MSEVDCLQLPLLLLGERLLGQDLAMQPVMFADAELRQASVQPLQQHTGLAQRLAGDVATAVTCSLHRHLHAVPHGEVLPRVDDVDDGARPHALQVLQEGPGVASVSVGRVDALGGEVVQLFEVRVQDDLLLVRVFERLAARHDSVAFAGRGDGGAAAQSSNVATQDVHQNRLRNVVGVVTCAENTQSTIFDIKV